MGFGETRTFQISIPSWWGFPWCLQSQTSCPGTALALEARLLTSVYSTLDYALSWILNQCVHVLLKYVCVCACMPWCVCVGGGQRTTCGDRFFPSTVTVLGMNSGHRVWQQEPLLTSIPSAQEDSSYYLLILLWKYNIIGVSNAVFPITKKKKKKKDSN